jgi:hypothetical protein
MTEEIKIEKVLNERDLAIWVFQNYIEEVQDHYLTEKSTEKIPQELETADLMSITYLWNSAKYWWGRIEHWLYRPAKIILKLLDFEQRMLASYAGLTLSAYVEGIDKLAQMSVLNWEVIKFKTQLHKRLLQSPGFIADSFQAEIGRVLIKIAYDEFEPQDFTDTLSIYRHWLSDAVYVSSLINVLFWAKKLPIYAALVNHLECYLANLELISTEEKIGFEEIQADNHCELQAPPTHSAKTYSSSSDLTTKILFGLVFLSLIGGVSGAKEKKEEDALDADNLHPNDLPAPYDPSIDIRLGVEALEGQPEAKHIRLPRFVDGTPYTITPNAEGRLNLTIFNMGGQIADDPKVMFPTEYDKSKWGSGAYSIFYKLIRMDYDGAANITVFKRQKQLPFPGNPIVLVAGDWTHAQRWQLQLTPNKNLTNPWIGSYCPGPHGMDLCLGDGDDKIQITEYMRKGLVIDDGSGNDEIDLRFAPAPKATFCIQPGPGNNKVLGFHPTMDRFNLRGSLYSGQYDLRPAIAQQVPNGLLLNLSTNIPATILFPDNPNLCLFNPVENDLKGSLERFNPHTYPYNYIQCMTAEGLPLSLSGQHLFTVNRIPIPFQEGSFRSTFKLFRAPKFSVSKDAQKGNFTLDFNGREQQMLFPTLTNDEFVAFQSSGLQILYEPVITDIKYITAVIGEDLSKINSLLESINWNTYLYYSSAKTYGGLQTGKISITNSLDQTVSAFFTVEFFDQDDVTQTSILSRTIKIEKFTAYLDAVSCADTTCDMLPMQWSGWNGEIVNTGSGIKIIPTHFYNGEQELTLTATLGGIEIFEVQKLKFSASLGLVLTTLLTIPFGIAGLAVSIKGLLIHRALNGKRELPQVKDAFSFIKKVSSTKFIKNLIDLDVIIKINDAAWCQWYQESVVEAFWLAMSYKNFALATAIFEKAQEIQFDISMAKPVGVSVEAMQDYLQTIFAQLNETNYPLVLTPLKVLWEQQPEDFHALLNNNTINYVLNLHLVLALLLNLPKRRSDVRSYYFKKLCEQIGEDILLSIESVRYYATDETKIIDSGDLNDEDRRLLCIATFLFKLGTRHTNSHLTHLAHCIYILSGHKITLKKESVNEKNVLSFLKNQGVVSIENEEKLNLNRLWKEIIAVQWGFLEEIGIDPRKDNGVSNYYLEVLFDEFTSGMSRKYLIKREEYLAKAKERFSHFITQVEQKNKEQRAEAEEDLTQFLVLADNAVTQSSPLLSCFGFLSKANASPKIRPATESSRLLPEVSLSADDSDGLILR